MESDAQLVTKIRQGDRNAFDTLYTRYERPLFHYVQRYLKNKEEAEEVFHDVFLKVLNPKDIEYVGESLRGWLYVTARNMSFNRLRKQQRTFKVKKLLTQSSVDFEDLEATHIKNDLQRRLIEKSDQLPETQKKVFQLRLAGLNHKEISQHLNVPEGTVKSRFHSVMQFLKKGMSQ